MSRDSCAEENMLKFFWALRVKWGGVCVLSMPFQKFTDFKGGLLSQRGSNYVIP